MENAAQAIGLQSVSHLPEFQQLLFVVGREKLSTANPTLRLEMQAYDSNNETPDLSALNVWLDNTLSEFDAVNDFQEYMRILNTLVRLAQTSRVVRKKIAEWIFLAFQRNKHTNFYPQPSKCWQLFCFAVRIRHEILCMRMIDEDNQFASTLYLRMLIRTCDDPHVENEALFPRMTYNVFRTLYERFINDEPHLRSTLILPFLRKMALLEDSNESRQKVRLWMRIMENTRTEFGEIRSVHWVSDHRVFPQSNVCMELVRAGLKNACILQTLYSTYSELGVDMRQLMNAPLESPWGGSPYKSASMEWVCCLGQLPASADSKLTMFVLRMTDLNSTSPETTGDQTLTFIHYLIIYHESVEKYADYQSILRFLESGDAQFDKSIRCTVLRAIVDPAGGDFDALIDITAFELARRTYMAERQLPPQHRHPSEFLLGLLQWLRQN